jgi:hypothetical protein
MIDVIYHGDSQYLDATRTNHDQMLNLLRQNWPTVTHWREQIDSAQDCEFERNGPCEIWRFYQRLKPIGNPLVIYLSTEVWFGPGAAEAVLAEAKDIVERENDIAFLGSDFQESYGEQHCRHRLSKHQRLGEHVVIAWRSSLNSESVAMCNLRNSKHFKDAARSWPAVVSDADRALTVQCQTYLVRRLDRELSDWRAGWDYLRTSSHNVRLQHCSQHE